MALTVQVTGYGKVLIDVQNGLLYRCGIENATCVIRNTYRKRGPVFPSGVVTIKCARMKQDLDTDSSVSGGSKTASSELSETLSLLLGLHTNGTDSVTMNVKRGIIAHARITPQRDVIQRLLPGAEYPSSQLEVEWNRGAGHDDDDDDGGGGDGAISEASRQSSGGDGGGGGGDRRSSTDSSSCRRQKSKPAENESETESSVLNDAADYDNAGDDNDDLVNEGANGRGDSSAGDTVDSNDGVRNVTNGDNAATQQMINNVSQAVHDALKPSLPKIARVFSQTSDTGAGGKQSESATTTGKTSCKSSIVPLAYLYENIVWFIIRLQDAIVYLIGTL